MIVTTEDMLGIIQLQLSFDLAKPQEEKNDRPGAVKAFKCCCHCRCLTCTFVQTLYTDAEIDQCCKHV